MNDLFSKLSIMKDSIHAGNVHRGFYEDGGNPVSLKAMIAGEMFEALEADRTGMWYSNREHTMSVFSPESFKICIKDTVEDELADTVIRILDLWGFNPIYGQVNNPKLKVSRIGDDNVPKFVYLWNKLFVNEYHRCLATIINFCVNNNIDLMCHVEMKLKYNATRGKKHGNKLY